MGAGERGGREVARHDTSRGNGNTAISPRDTPELAEKRAEEAAMVSEMIALWCRGGITRTSLAATMPRDCASYP